VATALGRPIINGIKEIWFSDSRREVFARREAPGGGWETYDLPLPAVLGVKEGLNLPRYPSVQGRLRLPAEERTAAEVIGSGPEAAPAVVDLLQRIGVLAR